jgi:hypothetical protein
MAWRSQDELIVNPFNVLGDGGQAAIDDIGGAALGCSSYVNFSPDILGEGDGSHARGQYE